LFNAFAFAVVIYVLVSKLIVFEVLIKGVVNVNAFSFVVNNVLVEAFKFDILFVCPLINNIDADEKEFKLLDKPDIDKNDELDNEYKFVNNVVVEIFKLDKLVV
jgi:hypothetical protein